MSFAFVALHTFVVVYYDSTYSLRISRNLYLFIVSHMVTFVNTSLID